MRRVRGTSCRLPGALLALALAVGLDGCADLAAPRGLVPGQSRVEDVERRMGPAVEQRARPGGETVRYYTTLPAGRETYAARFAPDGRLVSIEQRLTEENIARLKPQGIRASEVRDLLGPPARMDRLERLEREVWTYPVVMAGYAYPRVVHFQFSADGILREIVRLDDPRFRRAD